MELQIIGSSSAGNCYLLRASNGETLIIEMGVNFKKVYAVLDFRLKDVAGVLVTHEHGDHSKGLDAACAHGLNVYGSAGTLSALPFTSHRLHPIYKHAPFMVGSFKVLAFDVQHDAAEPLGFLIHHPESGQVLFLTDTNFVKYRFPGLNNIIVEANYAGEVLDERLFSGSLHPGLRNRVIDSHMSIETTCELLKANDLRAVNNIVLIHLSDGNSDELGFVEQVKAVAPGCVVTAADRNMTINLNKTPF